ncbi:DNA polymerase [Candidatus Micrarchaeota archaeon]|nr:DNA polymerase [Candidatus Micrarchaeota archaeon]
MQKKAYFLEADYEVYEGNTYLRLLLKGEKIFNRYVQYDPYFLAEVLQKDLEQLKKLKVKRKDGEYTTIKGTENIEKEGKKLVKVICRKPSDVPLVRQAIPYPSYEYDILYSKRAIMDLGIEPFSFITYEEKGEKEGLDGKIIKILKIEERGVPELKKSAFDIETYNPEGAPREKKDPAIMISYADEKSSMVFSYKKDKQDYVELCENEGEMIKRFCEKLEKENVEILLGYNSAQFDLPYLKARAEKNNIELKLGSGRSGFKAVTKGLMKGAKINGMVHVDLYPGSRFFGFIGLIKPKNYKLKNVYPEFTGKKKFMVERLNIWEMWDDPEKIGELFEYSRRDSEITLELGNYILPLQLELSTITRMPLFDVTLSTSGQLVESLLMSTAIKRKEIVPSKPSGGAIAARMKNPVQGAYVKLPTPGIYDDIVVFDFRGLYPSIIVSYNIEPNSITKEEGYESPTGARFRKEPKGLIPIILNKLIDRRVKVKKELKQMADENKEYKKLMARSHALKILANSFYGYMGYARSRWYSRECAESITAWGREHIQEAIKKAEECGFEVLYGDTDSVFLLLKNKTKTDVFAFLKKINDGLPEKMELELEGFYKRGLFVSKKSEQKGAKKKYALLGENEKIKIKGFELVRRDWSKLAKDTQFKVLETILKEGSKEKAVRIVRERIEELKQGTVPLEELAILTQIKKDPKDYNLMSPEIAAARKGIKKGKEIGKGSMISYVIGKKGNSISEKAVLFEDAVDYDVDYYLNNQLLPAVMKILSELGYSKYDLKMGGKQKGIEDFF